jgi:hypothetical protein
MFSNLVDVIRRRSLLKDTTSNALCCIAEFDYCEREYHVWQAPIIDVSVLTTIHFSKGLVPVLFPPRVSLAVVRMTLGVLSDWMGKKALANVSHRD